MGLLKMYDAFNESVLKRVEGVMTIFAAGAAAGALITSGVNATKQEQMQQQLIKLTEAVEAFTGAAAERASEALETGAARIEEFDTEAAEEAVRERANEGAGTLLEGAGDRFRNFLGGAEEAPAGPGE